MQQLKIEHKNKIEKKKDRRECKGRSLALTRKVYRLVNTDVFYVESESSNDIYYFVKYKPDILEWCTCPDNSLRGGQMKCKHLHAIEFAIKSGTIRDTADKLPTDVKRDIIQSVALQSKSYKDDDYSF